MDYVLNLMEQYASSLEQEVEERTRELVDEKKKSDILLFRMLPKQVVEKLKSGESVEPEQFQTATVFFSDIVQFTVLASKCTPLQVVNILNSLYTSLDNIIENFDVYKVGQWIALLLSQMVPKVPSFKTSLWLQNLLFCFHSPFESA